MLQQLYHLALQMHMQINKNCDFFSLQECGREHCKVAPAVKWHLVTMFFVGGENSKRRSHVKMFALLQRAFQLLFGILLIMPPSYIFSSISVNRTKSLKFNYLLSRNNFFILNMCYFHLFLNYYTKEQLQVTHKIIQLKTIQCKTIASILYI